MFGYKVKEQLVEKVPGSVPVAVFIFKPGRAASGVCWHYLRRFGKCLFQRKATCFVPNAGSALCL